MDHIICTHSTPNVTHTLGQVEVKKLCPNPTPMSSVSHMERANNKCQSKPPCQRKACLQVKSLSVYPNNKKPKQPKQASKSTQGLLASKSLSVYPSNKKPKQQMRELCNKHEHVGKALNGIS